MSKFFQFYLRRFALLALCTFPLVFMPQCDLSGLFGVSKGNSSSSSNPSSPSSTSYITSYVVTQAANPTYFTQNYTANIIGTNVYIELPYTVVSEQIAIVPTVTMQSGYTISPSGSYATTNGMVLQITNTATQQIYNYHLYVSVDPTTVSFLKLIGPFYWSTGGVKTDMTANCSLALNLTDAFTGTYRLTLNTDSFGPYGPSIASGILARPIGFATVTTPTGAIINVNPAIAGTAVPYTVSVQPVGQTTASTFTLNATRTLSTSTALTDVSFTVAPVFSDTTTLNTGSDLASFLNSSYTLSYTGTCDTGSDTVNNSWTYNTIYSAPGAGCAGYSWSGIVAPSSYAANVTTTSAQATSNNAIIAQYNSSSSITYRGSSMVIDNGTTIQFNSAETVAAPSTTTNTAAVAIPLYGSVAASFAATYSVPNFNNPSGYDYYPFSGSSSPSINTANNFNVTTTNAYKSLQYYAIISFVVTLPKTMTIQTISPYGMIQSYSQTSDSQNNYITFIMNPYTTHLTGDLARVVVVAEDGVTTATDYISVI